MRKTYAPRAINVMVEKAVFKEGMSIHFNCRVSLRVNDKGEWCTGCTALCQHKRAEHITKTNGSLRDYPEFIKNVNTVTEKVIQQIELKFGND